LPEEFPSEDNVENRYFNEPSTPPHDFNRRSMMSPNKTGGLIELANL